MRFLRVLLAFKNPVVTTYTTLINIKQLPFFTECVYELYIILPRKFSQRIL
jgi:hypothetical protein